MRRLSVAALTIVGGISSSALIGASPRGRLPHHDDQARAHAWVDSAVQAVGGAAALRARHTIRLVGIYEENGTGWSLHRDEARPNFERFTELQDLEHQRVRRTAQWEAVSHTEPQMSTLTVDLHDSAGAIDFGGRTIPAFAGLASAAAQRMQTDPHTVLLAVASAADLRVANDTSVDGSRYHVVEMRGGAVRLLLRAATFLPFAVESRASFADDPDRTLWGDIVTRTVWTSWVMEPDGVRFPRTWTVYRNGLWAERYSFMNVARDVPAPADSFAISESIRARTPRNVAAAYGRADSPPSELADGVVLIHGIFNVVLVRQDDGIVVIEAPTTADYSRAVLHEVARRFPGRPVKAVVTTDFMWAHFGGIREYVARGIPVYAPFGQEEALRRAATSPHTIQPDSLARAPRPLQLRIVSGRTVLGAGPNRVELIYAAGLGSENGERMMVAYLPGSRLLYTSDLLPFPAYEAAFVRQGSRETFDLVQRERLSVATVFGIHVPPSPWQMVADTIARVASR
jgi:hypothetical protein